MIWEDFVEECEKAKPGSDRKLERIREKGEARCTKDNTKIALERNGAALVLHGLFVWSETEEEKKDLWYWKDLYDLLLNN